MTNKEAIEHLKELKTLRIEFPNPLQEQALDMAIKALDIYKTFCPVEFPTEDDPYPVCSYTRPKGEWIKGREISKTMLGYRVEHIEYKDYTCSNCGLVLDNLLYKYDGSPFYKFCPNCGAAMKE